MKLAIGTYGANWYTVDFSDRGFSNLEAHSGRDFSCIRSFNGGVYAVTENSAEGPCYLTPVEGTQYLIASNFGSGSVDLFAAVSMSGNQDSGVFISSLEKRGEIQFRGSGPVTENNRQIHSRVHQVVQIPWEMEGAGDVRLFLATDFGSDAIRVLCLGEKFDTLSRYKIETPAGSGPRHLAFNSEHKLLYCLCEISNELLVYSFSGFENIRLLQRIDISKLGANGEVGELKPAAGDMLLHPFGGWLYATRRIVNEGVLKFDVGEDGLLFFSSFVATGKHPRSLRFMSTAGSMVGSDVLFVSCKDEAVQVFSLDDKGNLQGELFRLELPYGDMPVWVEPLR